MERPAAGMQPLVKQSGSDVPAGADQAVTLRPDGVLVSRLAGTPDSAFLFVGGTEGRQETHPCQFGPAEVIWDAIENN